jgi:hypothetical protein
MLLMIMTPFHLLRINITFILINPHHDSELILYHTARQANNKTDVFIINYDPNRPDLIRYQYNSPCAESIIDYPDAIELKIKLTGIHDSTDLMAIFEDHIDVEASAIFKRQLNDVNRIQAIRVLEVCATVFFTNQKDVLIKSKMTYHFEYQKNTCTSQNSHML